MNCEDPCGIMSSPISKQIEQIEQADPGGVTCTKRSSGHTVWSKSTFHPSLALLRERGVDCDGVDEQPWGRFVRFDDPDGNRWALQQSVRP